MNSLPSGTIEHVQDTVLINDSRFPPKPARQPGAFLEGTAYVAYHTAPQTTLSTNWWLTHHCEMGTVIIIISSLEKQEPRPVNNGSELSNYWETEVEFKYLDPTGHTSSITLEWIS